MKIIYVSAERCLVSASPQDRGVKEDELQSILNYLLTMHEVGATVFDAEIHSGTEGGMVESAGVELVAKCALKFVGWSYSPLKQARV